MSTLWLTEYKDMLVIRGQGVPVPLEPAITTQKLTITATAAASAPFNTETKMVVLYADAAAHVLFSAAGTDADTSDRPVNATEATFVGVDQGPGTPLRVSAVTQ